MQVLLSFCEIYKRNSDQLLNLFSNDKRESIPKVINYFTETLPRFTMDDFQSHFQRSIILINFHPILHSP